MNRLQKKCFIAAAGLHLLLVLILFVGPAFLPSRKVSSIVPLDFVPANIVDAAIAGGGNPTVKPSPAAEPPTPTPLPQPFALPPQPMPEPKEVVKQESPKIIKPNPESLETKPEPKPVKPKAPQISTTIVKRNTNDFKAAANAARAKELADAKQRAAQISQALSGLKSSLSPSTTVEFGPGGGGETYGSFDRTVLGIYDRAWISPEGMDASEAVVGVKVVIEPDGTVSSAKIIQSSGDARLDRSVKQALERVSSVPVPKETNKQRTIEFNFRARAKQAI